MELSGWKERFHYRDDMTTRLTHLTKGNSYEEAYETLIKIIEERSIKGGLGYVNGNNRVVCLQELPLNMIAQNLLYEKVLNDRVRYLAFGVRFSKVFVDRIGGRPVIYGRRDELMNELSEKYYWRIVNMNLSDTERMIDWSSEREWRVKGDLNFDYKDIEIIVPNNKYYRRFIDFCLDNNKVNIIKEINGIIPLASISL